MRTAFWSVALSLMGCAWLQAGESARDRVIARLRPHVMLGVAAAPGDKWIEETQAQGARWDVRYQYICGGANTPNNWKTWNQPAGAFAKFYLDDSAKQGCIPCLTYYQMLQCAPGHGQGGEDAVNKINCTNAETMRAYFDDFIVLLKACGEFKQTVLLHHEPDLWGYFMISPVFAPNTADGVKVQVKSSGHPDATAFADSAAGFGKCLVAMRDKYAPNALLACHVSKWGAPDTDKVAAFLAQCGSWDLLFSDPSDRDSAWKLAKNYHAEGAWWKEEDFTGFRDWCAQLHRKTGLPLIAWQIPMGNTIMASCDNTEGHYMDNRPEYFLEKYPENTHLAEWARAGFVGFLFGGGAGGCTSTRDTMKDGVTNPAKIEGNRGEQAQFADDDGGYLRLRAGNYYRKGPYPLKGEPPKPETAKPAPVASAPAVELAKLDLSVWHPRLAALVAEGLKAGHILQIHADLMGKKGRYRVKDATPESLKVDMQGNPWPLAWKELPPGAAARLALDAGGAGDGQAQDGVSAEAFAVAAAYHLAAGERDQAETCLAQAARKDAASASAARKTLGLGGE
ncbi:MAG: hypothetical protein AMXMBFR7_26100 [Planctomycetota bacterium]